MSNFNDALQILEKYKNIVWPEVNKYLSDPIFPSEFSIPKKYRGDVKKYFWNIVKEYPERKGKYLRPTILLLVANSMGVNLNKSIKTAAAMQISEEWLLIHDDFEDKSTTRRGKKALHRLFGNELAVNAGDSLHIIMWKVLLDNFHILGNKKALKIANEFYTMLSRTAQGQGVEIGWMVDDKPELSDEDWYFVADGKTGYYSMAGPARLGGILGDASKKQLDLLAKFGLYIGRCFQLVDDILDITSDFSGLKERGNDIYEGKRTLLLGHLLRNANPEDLKKIKTILAKSRDEKTAKEVDWVIKKMYDYKTIEYAWRIARKLKIKSEKIFKAKLKFLKANPARNNLLTLINFILERKY